LFVLARKVSKGLAFIDCRYFVDTGISSVVLSCQEGPVSWRTSLLTLFSYWTARHCQQQLSKFLVPVWVYDADGPFLHHFNCITLCGS